MNRISLFSVFIAFISQNKSQIVARNHPVPGNVIIVRQIDDNIIEIIALLNKKGFKTFSSCGGSDGHSIYVSMNETKILKEIPIGFTLSRNRIDENLTITIIEHSLSERHSKKEISRLINVLNEWCKTLF